ncbi:hypothetical protein ISCGN_023471 [Ixodes scapularis]
MRRRPVQCTHLTKLASCRGLGILSFYRGGTCESRSLESGVSTDLEPRRGHLRLRCLVLGGTYAEAAVRGPRSLSKASVGTQYRLRDTECPPSPLTPTETSAESQTPEAPQKLTKSKALPQRLAPKVRVVLDPTRSQVRKGSPPSSTQGVEEAMEVNGPSTEGSMETATPVPSCSKAGNVSSAPLKKSAQASQVPADSSGRGRAQPTRLTDNPRKPGHSDEAVSLKGPEVSTEEKMEEASLASDDDLLHSGAESLSSSAAYTEGISKEKGWGYVEKLVLLSMGTELSEVSLALRGLPEALGVVPGVEHAIYADDITLWCREGNDAEIEERLQAAAKIVEDYAEECGLKCAPEKSELLVLRNPYERVSEQIEVWVRGKRVSKPTEIRILGQLIRQGRGNKSTIDKLDTMATQLKRLASTKNGALLMDKLGMAVPGGTHTGTVPDHKLSAEIRKKIVLSRIPRNMQPGKDDGRRKARSEALSKTWDHREGTLYVDCGGPVNGVATIAVANAQGRVLRLASVRVESAGQAEEAAIALAVVCNPRATVISDSQKACGNFARGVVCAIADRILRKTEVQGVHLIWSPGHMGNTGNEAANAAARGCILRDSSQSGGQMDTDLSFNEALKMKKLDRRVFPSPCGGFGKEEEWTWRRLQTGTLVTPAKLHQWYPDRYTTGACPFCGDPSADVHHITWECKKIPGLAPLVEPSTQEWEAGLQSEVIDVQKLLVTRALHAQTAIGALE